VEDVWLVVWSASTYGKPLEEEVPFLKLDVKGADAKPGSRCESSQAALLC